MMISGQRLMNCCDHEDHWHRPYCWDWLLLYVRTLYTVHDPLMVSQNKRRDNRQRLMAPRGSWPSAAPSLCFSLGQFWRELLVIAVSPAGVWGPRAAGIWSLARYIGGPPITGDQEDFTARINIPSRLLTRVWIISKYSYSCETFLTMRCSVTDTTSNNTDPIHNIQALCSCVKSLSNEAKESIRKKHSKEA